MIEHKETTFKILKHVSKSWFIRSIGITTSFILFIGSVFLGAFVLSAKNKDIYKASFWKDFAYETLHYKGIFFLIRKSISYMKPGFYPSLPGSESLLHKIKERYSL